MIDRDQLQSIGFIPEAAERAQQALHTLRSGTALFHGMALIALI